MISRITAYDGATQKCTVSPAFAHIPSYPQETAWIIPHMNIDSNELTQSAVDAIVNSLSSTFFSASGLVGSSGNSTTTVNLAGASSTDSMYVGQVIRIVASDIITAAASRVVSYVGSTNIATIYPALPFTPDNTYIYAITPDAPSLLQSGTGTGQLNLSSGRVGINWADVTNPTTTLALTGTTISTSQVAASVTGSVGSVASGGITASSLASSTITAAKFAANAVDANALATDAVTEIAGGILGNTSNKLTTDSSGNVTLAAATHTGAVIPTVSTVSSVTAIASGGITAASLASSTITAAKFAANAIDANALATDAIDEIVLAVQGNLFIDGGIIGATNTLTTATINGLLTSTFDDTYNGQIIRIVSPGTARDGQTRTIVGYVGSTQIVTVSPGFNAVPTSGDIYAIYPSAPGQLTSEANTAIVDAIPALYHADIALTKASSTDEYTATWFKNGVRVTSGITSPTVQVVKRSDGADLVASTSMTQIGTTGSYKYDEGTNRMVAGEAYIALATASIDASTRSFSRVIGRDS